MVQRDEQTLKDVSPLPGPLQLVLAASLYHGVPMIDIVQERTLERESAGLAFHKGEHIDAKGGLQLRVLQQTCQHRFPICPTLELNDDADAHAIRLVAQITDTFHASLSRQGRNAPDERGLVHLIGQLRHHQRHAPATELFRVDLRSHDDAATPCRIGLAHALIAQDHAARREIWPLDELHQLVERHILRLMIAIHQVRDGVGDLAQVVRWDIRGHTDRDPTHAVHEQIGHFGRQHQGFLQCTVKVIREVHGVFIEIGEHLLTYRTQPRLGVTYGSGPIPIDGPKVALAIDERVTHVEVLSHAHHRLIDGGIAMGMVFAQHFSHDACALACGPIVA